MPGLPDEIFSKWPNQLFPAKGRKAKLCLWYCYSFFIKNI